jgi:putative methyltransferase (TIGR04325 family)
MKLLQVCSRRATGRQQEDNRKTTGFTLPKINGIMNKLIQYAKKQYLRVKYARYGWHGNYANWRTAANKCTGYDGEAILTKVRAATLKVKNGEAVYERDAMLFDHIEYSWPLLANLLWIAGQQAEKLSLIDFGGSLGSSYFQNRYYLQHLNALQWDVVEQAAFVTTGERDIADNQLHFFATAQEAIAAHGRHDVLLLSCVLPYIEKPYELLEHLAALGIPYIIVDNTYFNPAAGNRLTVQKVPPVYYDASYPAWFLDYDQIIATLETRYKMITAYANEQILYLDGELVQYKGFIMQLKSPAPTAKNQ